MGTTNETYFDRDEFMTVSQFKRFQKCELNAIQPDAMVKSVALLVGSYVDSYVEGTLEQFKEDNPEIFSSRGATKGELKSDYKQADDICAYIDNDKTIQQFLSGEKQTIMTGEIEGIPFKIKMDSYSKGIAISDLKVMRSVTDSYGQFTNFVGQWGYDLQLACYQEIVFQNTGERLPCFIVAVTKETPTNSVIINIPQVSLDIALDKVKLGIKRYYDVKMEKENAIGCGVCPTCISLRKSTPIISMDDLL